MHCYEALATECLCSSLERLLLEQLNAAVSRYCLLALRADFGTYRARYAFCARAELALIDTLETKKTPSALEASSPRWPN